MPLAFYLLPLGPMPRWIRSDTLAGAIIWSLASMGEDVAGLVEDKNLRISSGFPFFNIEQKIMHFGPKPRLPISDTSELKGLRNRKEFKKASFLEAGLLNKIIKGEIGIDYLWKKSDIEYKIIDELVIAKDLQSGLEKEGKIHFVGKKEIERNEINRFSGKASNFYHSYGYLYCNAGLYFLLEGSEKWKKAAVKAIRFLEDRGIGGEISIGYGRFKFLHAEESSPFEAPVDSDAIMTLSMYLPTQEEWKEASSKESELFYTLVRRAGIRHDGALKREVLFLGEGSVIPIKSAIGREETLTESPKSLAWGRPYYIGIHTKGLVQE